MPKHITASVCFLDTKTSNEISIHPSGADLISHLVSHATKNWPKRNLQDVASPDGLGPTEIIATFYAEGGDNRYQRGSVDFDPSVFPTIDELIQLRNLLANLSTSAETNEAGADVDPEDAAATLDQLVLLARNIAI